MPRPLHLTSKRLIHQALWVLLAAAPVWLTPAACSPPGEIVAGVAKGGFEIQDPQDPARDYDIDMGNMPYGETRERLVRMKNVEGRALVIRGISQGCSCTQTRLSYVDASGARVEGPLRWADRTFEVPKDAVLELVLRVDSKLVPARNTVKRVIVRIESDSQVEPFKTLEVHTIVELPFYVVPAKMNLGRVPLGGIVEGRVEISQALGTGEQISGVLSTPENMEAVLENPGQSGSAFWRLTVRWFPPRVRGTSLRNVVLKTTGPGGVGEGAPLDIAIEAISVDDVIAEPMAFALPARLEVNAGAGAVTLRSMVGGNRLFVSGASTEGPLSEAFKASAVAVAPDDRGRSEKWLIQLTCVRPIDFKGAFAGAVVVMLDDATTPQVRIPYTHKAQP